MISVATLASRTLAVSTQHVPISIILTPALAMQAMKITWATGSRVSPLIPAMVFIHGTMSNPADEI